MPNMYTWEGGRMMPLPTMTAPRDRGTLHWRSSRSYSLSSVPMRRLGLNRSHHAKGQTLADKRAGR